MNRTNLFFLVFILSASLSLYGFGNKTFFITRSQSVNAVRELVGLQKQIYNVDKDYWYGTGAITVEYGRSFNPKKIREVLFGTSCPLIFSGSKVKDRGEDDILADYFGLPFGFKSSVEFSPHITNFVFDLNWYQSLDTIIEGLYFRVHAPIVHTKWDLHLCEQVLLDQDATFTFYPAGYIAPERIVRKDMHNNVKDAFKGVKIIGDRELLKFGKIFDRQTEARVAEIQFALGWNFLFDQDYHLGIHICTAIPTGTNPDAEFLFEPIAGNGHHWEAGGGLSGHYTFWRSENKDDAIAIYLDSNITHLFADTQKRSYDLKNNGAGSRYMLLQEFNCVSTNLHLGNNGPSAPNQYIGRLLPAINETTLDTKIKIVVQADIVLKFAYQHKDFELDFGYNFWGRSKEKLVERTCFPGNRFAIKGDLQIYGFDSTQLPVRLNATQSKATIKKSQGVGNFITGSEFKNLNTDFPILAFDTTNANLENLKNADANALNLPNNDQINTSNLIVLLTDCDINNDSVLLPKAITHKFFIHLNHVRKDTDSWVPYIGGGVAVEWVCRCVNDNSAHSQWSLWVKGGVSY